MVIELKSKLPGILKSKYSVKFSLFEGRETYYLEKKQFIGEDDPVYQVHDKERIDQFLEREREVLRRMEELSVRSVGDGVGMLQWIIISYPGVNNTFRGLMERVAKKFSDGKTPRDFDLENVDHLVEDEFRKFRRDRRA